MKMKQELSIDVIKRWINSCNRDVRHAAMLVCKGRTDIPLELVERGLKDTDHFVSCAATRLCADRTDISLNVIERWLMSSNSNVRLAAMYACKGRIDIPLDVIKRGMDDDGDYRVRDAAICACEGRKDLPIIRAFEPPERVYKKCLGDVIVVAEIPKDAQIRGSYDWKSRTNKAKIVDIIGTFGGEKVGISLHDKKTTYFIGDDVEIEDFNFGNAECSAGFHFFCTLEQAKEYKN